MASTPSSPSPTSRRSSCEWTTDEHARYEAALVLYPNAKWKVIATYVGTRTARQTMTHAHKIALKQKRHARGLRTAGRPRTDPRKRLTETTVDLVTSRFLDLFKLDALKELESLHEEHVWMDQPPESPTSPGTSTFTFGVFGGSDDVIDAFDWDLLP